MKVLLVDPPAFTPPYDRALAAALAACDIDITLVTAPFPHGDVPDANGVDVDELFYRRSRTLPPRLRRVARGVEHFPDMWRFSKVARSADIAHYMWLSLPALDSLLLPASRSKVFTMHYRLPNPRSFQGRSYRRVLASMDHVIIHTESGRERLIADFGVDESMVSVIPMGAFDYLSTDAAAEPLASELETDRQVILAFGLIKPYKRTELLIEAMRSVPNAELWVVGMPRMPMDDLKRSAQVLGDRVRFVERFVPEHAIPAFFRRADVVALPYDHIEQSAVLYTALAFGKPIVLSDVGGFPEVAGLGGAVLFEPGNSEALASRLNQVLSDSGLRQRLGSRARELATTEYSWTRVGELTADVYRQVLATR